MYGSRVFFRSTPPPPPAPPAPAAPSPPPTPPPSPTPPPPPRPPPPAGTPPHVPTPPPTSPPSPPICYEYPKTIIPSQYFYNSNVDYEEEYEKTTMGYNHSNGWYCYYYEKKTETWSVPDYFYPYGRGPGPYGNVWIYPYKQQPILLPLIYYDCISMQDVPPNGFTPQFTVNENGLIITYLFRDVAPDPILYMEVVPDFYVDRYSLFYPEDGEACLRIIEILLPLQIATGRVPGYFEYVKHPVILGNIKHRIIDGKYTRVRDVIHDLRAIVWNMKLYLCKEWEDGFKEENNRFSAALEGQLGLYYPDNPFTEITGNHERKPL